jgi:hypothetical protein
MRFARWGVCAGLLLAPNVRWADAQRRVEARWFLEHAFERSEKHAALVREAISELFDELKDADENFVAGFLSGWLRDDGVAVDEEYAALVDDPNSRRARVVWLGLLLCQSVACTDQIARVLQSGGLEEDTLELLSLAATAETMQQLRDAFVLNGDDVMEVLHGSFAATGNLDIVAGLVQEAALFRKETLLEEEDSAVALAAFDRGRRARSLLAKMAIAHKSVRAALQSSKEAHVQQLLHSIARDRV